MKRTGISGRKFATRRGRFSALSAAAVLLAIPTYGDHDTASRGQTTTAPASAADARVGALFKEDLDGGHFCTASVVHSAGHDLIVTAAHCLSTDGSQDGRTVFAPAYRDGSAPYGTWPVESVYADDSWNEDGDQDSDVAFAVLGPGSDGGKQVEDVVGGAPLFTGRATGGPVTVTGYPSDTEVPQVCTNTSVAYGDSQQRIDCPGYPGGTSGSPWVVEGGAVAGVIGGYEFGGDDPDVSYSVVFGPVTKSLYKLAESAGTPKPAPAPSAAPTPAAGTSAGGGAAGSAGAGGDDAAAAIAEVTKIQALVCACLLP
ncbi:serine protease [Streptomyces sp. NBC_00083]|uniref:trypsin-like serine peptidase n=1 Tax=Streptomyces sp. NBC_00083 TaxID=2975647 RepID=UPI00224ECA55|nr:trypsin-like peptidase domain-containing protein [Streptomyces sp. NBC_00083]MCX5387770.1 trypsin-like peptidase domain-containing protein [Streptomyces sp. NBC_00083]